MTTDPAAPVPDPPDQEGKASVSRGTARLRWVLGDTLIVVVGVLIALAVDNWREQRRNERTESQYLSSLIQDLESDFAELDRAGMQAETAAASARTVLEVLAEESPSIGGDSLAYAVEQAGFLYFPAYFPYTFDELVSSGNLRVVGDPALRREIASYYNVIESEKQWWERYRGIQARYALAMQGILGPDIRSGIAYGTPVEVTEEKRRQILEALSATPDLPAALEGMLWLQDRQIRWHRVSRRRGESLRDLVADALAEQGG